MNTIVTAALVGASPITWAFTTVINNQGATDVKISTGGQTTCTATGRQITTCNMDIYTAYSASYKGTYADQGLFTIQKYTTQVLQITPVPPDPARANFVINLSADGNAGSVDNFQGGSGQFFTSGICRDDTGGVTCNLSGGENLQNLQIVLLEKQEPKSDDSPHPPSGGGYTRDYGPWDGSKAYDPTWTPTAQYPQVQYGGKQWISCSHVDVGAVPGQNTAPNPWNAWVVYDGSSKVCG